MKQPRDARVGRLNVDGLNVDGLNIDGLNIDGMDIDDMDIDGVNVDGVKAVRADARGARPGDAHPHAPRRVATALAPVLAALAPLLATGCAPSSAPATAPVTVAGRTFECRLALDEDARERGMGGVAEIGPDEGMLFVFPGSEQHNFWMRDCLIGLDIAFIDAAGFVTAVHTMPAEPLRAEGESESAYYARLKRYPSLTPAQYALEVAPGTLGPLGVRRGTRVEFDRTLLKTFAK